MHPATLTTLLLSAGAAINAQLTINLDSPPPFTQSWSSLSDLVKWAETLSIDPEWTVPALEKFRYALDKGGLHSKLKKDFGKTLGEIREWTDNKTLGAGSTGSDPAQDAIWKAYGEGSLAVGLEVGGCGTVKGDRVRKLIVDVEGPNQGRWGDYGHRFDGEVDEGKMMALGLAGVNVCDKESGKLRSCEDVHDEGAVKVAKGWIELPRVDGPTRLAIYSPAPLTPCSATSLTLSNFFGPSVNITTIDKSPIWTDPAQGAALLVGTRTPGTCSKNVAAAIASLPVHNRTQMRTEVGGDCENTLKKINLNLFLKAYNRLFNSSHSQSTASILLPMITANIQFPTSLNLTASTLPSISCAAWSQLPPIKAAMQVPHLATTGPYVETVAELMKVAFKIAAVSSGGEDLGNDTLLDSIAELCKSCADFEDISYEALATAWRNIETTPCDGTLFGGAAGDVDGVVSKLLIAEITTDDQARVQRRFVGVPLKIASETRPVVYFPQCRENDTLVFSVEGLGIMSGKGLRGNMTVLPSEFLAGGEIAGGLMSLKALVGGEEDGWAQVSVKVKEREFFGVYNLNVTVGESKFKVTPKAVSYSTLTILCGQTPLVPQSKASRPSNDSVSTFFAGLQPTKLSNIDIPVKYHVFSYTLPRTPHPHTLPTLSYLLSQSPLTALQQARKFNLSDLFLPASLRPLFNVTAVCEGVKGRVSGERVVYRVDLVDVGECLRGSDGVSGFLVREKGVGGAKFILFNVDLAKADTTDIYALLRAMERARLGYGFPIFVAGRLAAPGVASMIDAALRETGLWSTYYPPSTHLSKTVWTPYLPTVPNLPTSVQSKFNQHPASFHPQSHPITPLNVCLFPGTNSTQCAGIEAYASWFRSEIGGILGEDWWRGRERREGCAGVQGRHLPVLYEVFDGEKYLKLVTYNLGSLTPTNLLSIQESPTFQYLSTFDIVLLQGTNGDEGTSQKILSMIRSGNTVNATEIESTTLGGGSNYVEIFYRASEDRTVNCINERYGHNKNSIVACLFSAANSTSPLKPFIVANINDAHDGLLTSPIKDLEDDDVGIMKRVYARLCVQPECEDYGVPAVFVGTWGTALRGSGTWEAFKSGVESVEDEIIRKNQIGDSTFFSGSEPMMGVHVVVPTEHAVDDGEEEGSSFGGVIGWFTASTRATRLQWPYWTTMTGNVNDFAVLWTNASDDSQFLPAARAQIDVYGGYPVCEEGSGGECGGTDAACSRVEKGSYGGVGMKVAEWVGEAGVCGRRNGDVLGAGW